MMIRLAPILAVAALAGAAGPAHAGFAPHPDTDFYLLRDEAFAKVSDEPLAVATGDVNGDGTLDLVVPANESDFVPAQGRMHVFLGDGAGRFAQAPGSPYDVGSNPRGVVLADVSEDGQLDAVLAHDLQAADGANNAIFSVQVGQGNGVFLGGWTASTGGDASAAVAVGQFVGDAKPDIATVTARNSNAVVDGRVNVFHGTGMGVFGPRDDYFLAMDPEPRFMAAPDLNGDGQTDLVTSNRGGTLTILRQVTAGIFNQPAPVPGGASPQNGIASGDFDGDGDVDVAVASGTSPGEVTVLRSDGTAGSGSLVPFPGSPVETGGNGARGIAAADLTADGRLDLVVTNQQNPGQVALLAGDGAGGFAHVPGSPFSTSIVEQPAAVAVGDFDRDGQPDIATVHSENAARMVVLLNGDEPAARVGPGALAFGKRAVRSPRELSTTLTNDGPGLLRPGAAAVEGPGAAAYSVSADACAGATLTVGASCTIGVRFATRRLGAQAATLRVPHNGAGGSGAVELNGRGRRPIVRALKVSPRRFRLGRRTTFRFRLAERGRVTLRIQRREGRRWKPAGIVLRRKGRAGRNRVRFSGRTKRRVLDPGRHRVKVFSRDAEGHRSRPRTARFRLLPR